MNYLIYGEENGKIQKEIDKILQEYLKDDPFGCITFNANTVKFEEILNEATTAPFFSDKKVILVKNANFLSTSNDTDVDTAQLEAYLNHPLASTIFVMVGYFAKCDARKKIVKAVNKTCRVISCNLLDEQGKRAYILAALNEHHVKIDAAAKNRLIELLPNDTKQIDMEILKCSCYPEELHVSEITLLINRNIEDDVFQLVHAIMHSDMKKAFRIYQDLLVLNKDAIYLIAVLASQFRFYFQVKTLVSHGLSEAEVTSELKAHPYRVKLSIQAVSQTTCKELLAVLDELASCDQKIKTGLLDKKLGFELFLLKTKTIFA